MFLTTWSADLPLSSMPELAEAAPLLVLFHHEQDGAVDHLAGVPEDEQRHLRGGRWGDRSSSNMDLRAVICLLGASFSMRVRNSSLAGS